MRLMVFVSAFALLTGCAGGGSAPDATPSTTATPDPPASGASFADVASYIDAADAADPDDFREATLDGTTTDLEDDISFVAAGDTISCAVYTLLEDEMSCRVDFAEPLPEPSGIELNWLPDWVDFTGKGLDIGAFRGDAGVFAYGTGAELPVGRSLARRDFRCRADDDAVFCVNDAAESAVRLAADGVETFGCLKEDTPPPDVGARFTC